MEAKKADKLRSEGYLKSLYRVDDGGQAYFFSHNQSKREDIIINLIVEIAEIKSISPREVVESLGLNL